MDDIFDENSKNKMSKSRLYTIIGGMIGVSIASVATYFIRGEFPIEVMAGAVFASFLLLLFEFFKSGRRNGNLPETDERVSKNLFNFLSNLSHITIAVLVIGLTIVSLFNIEAIPIFHLWLFFSIYILVGAIGGAIVKSK